jgi:hypothetical protein
MRIFVRSMVILSLAAVPALAGPNEGEITRKNDLGVHGPASKTPAKPGDEPSLARALKKSRLAMYPSKTIGEAFEDYRYFVKREWRETPSVGGRIYVDFTGWFKTGWFDMRAIKERIASRGVGIKFLVNEDGSYGAVMASRVELRNDGKVYSQPLGNLDDILNKIYSNTEIRF